MSHRRKVSCVLCGLSEETKITGALSIKDEVTAHQNCLLFSSGIYCQNTPELDDLFGFSTDDVLREVKRGRRLVCKMCGKKGATAGCEVGRCKKTYHYPCAIQAKAKVIEDEDEGRYTLYCFGHNQKLQSEQSSRSVDERPSSSSTDSTSRGAETRARDKQSERFVDEHPSSSSTPSVSRENSERRGKDARSVYNSDSNSSHSATHSLSKRRLSDSDEQDELFIKRKNGGCKRNIINDSRKSDDNEPNTEMAPIDSDIDESTNSIQDDQVIRENADSRTEVASEDKQQSQDDETLLYSDESESLLHPEPRSSPVTRDKQSSPMAPNVIKVEDEKDQGSSPQQNLVQSPDQHHVGPSTEPPPSPSILNPQVTLNTDIPSLPVHSLASSIDSVSFWKSCNSAGCTQAIFTDFLHEMNKISRRIESDQASQEDYDLALKVIADSGKLAHLVDKQREELQRKQTELKKAGEAMNNVVSALKGQFKP
ncbi:dentin sialophosphoprotein [Betta splendens]|uniref:Dentin sialophosphoprotein n=1 Tax=Betta splendens TaxID=158456 RepID=A0A6P7LF42_BETSP|nr:dentin sialophosphoprotein [Betta splendens]